MKNNVAGDNGSIKDKDIVSTLSLGDNFSTFKFVLSWSMIVICIIGFVLLVITSYTENSIDDLYVSFKKSIRICRCNNVGYIGYYEEYFFERNSFILNNKYRDAGSSLVWFVCKT